MTKETVEREVTRTETHSIETKVDVPHIEEIDVWICDNCGHQADDGEHFHDSGNRMGESFCERASTYSFDFCRECIEEFGGTTVSGPEKLSISEREWRESRPPTPENRMAKAYQKAIIGVVVLNLSASTGFIFGGILGSVAVVVNLVAGATALLGLYHWRQRYIEIIET